MTDQNGIVSRRELLKSAGAAAAVAGLNLAAAPAPAKLESDRKIRIGVVGGFDKS